MDDHRYAEDQDKIEDFIDGLPLRTINLDASSKRQRKQTQRYGNPVGIPTKAPGLPREDEVLQPRVVTNPTPPSSPSPLPTPRFRFRDPRPTHPTLQGQDGVHHQHQREQSASSATSSHVEHEVMQNILNS